MAQNIEPPLKNESRITLEMLENDKEYVDKYYGGDAALLRKEVLESQRYSIKYKDIERYGIIFPQHRDEAYNLIRTYLGYIPNYAVFVPHEPTLRISIECRLRHTKDGYTQEEYEKDIYTTTRLIRNEDMRIDTWSDHIESTEADYNRYNTELMPYIQHARERLANFLGYYPELAHSLHAEVYLRSFMASDTFNLRWPHLACDYKAMNIVKFREILLTKGLDAAKESPLLGLHIKKAQCKVF